LDPFIHLSQNRDVGLQKRKARISSQNREIVDENLVNTVKCIDLVFILIWTQPFHIS